MRERRGRDQITCVNDPWTTVWGLTAGVRVAGQRREKGKIRTIVIE